jgi:hypothetical protein
MEYRRLRSFQRMGTALAIVATLLLVAGCAEGWLIPEAATLDPRLAFLAARLARNAVDLGAYLGADVTAISILIAIVVAVSGGAFQAAGRSSLRQAWRSLASFLAFFTISSFSLAVALIYLIDRPLYVAQLWQIFIWFIAVLFYTLNYLWWAMLSISREYVMFQSLEQLRRTPIARWQELDGYSRLQLALASTSAEGDLSAVHFGATNLGGFLARQIDHKAETENAYDRARYRALKNLLSGSVQNADSAPNAASYDLGFLAAGTLLQGIATGMPPDDPEHDLFTGVFRILRETPERINPLFTGMRHALCRGTAHTDAFLATYWLAHRRWSLDDPRGVTHVSAYLARFHADCWRTLRAAPLAGADAEAASLLLDLYRDIAQYLGPRLAREKQRLLGARTSDLALGLLDSVHAAVLRQWPEGTAVAERVAVVNAYEARRKELAATF